MCDRDLKEKLEADFSIAYFAQLQAISMPVVAVNPVVGRPVRRTADGVRDQSERSRSARARCSTTCVRRPATPCRPPNRSHGSGWTRGRSGTWTAVCVVNRNHLAAHLQNQLAPYVEANKWLTQPAVVEVYFKTWDFGFGVVGRHYDWGSHGMPDNLVIDVETSEMPATGELLVHTQFHATRTYEWLRGSELVRGQDGVRGQGQLPRQRDHRRAARAGELRPDDHQHAVRLPPGRPHPRRHPHARRPARRHAGHHADHHETGRLRAADPLDPAARSRSGTSPTSRTRRPRRSPARWSTCPCSSPIR